MKLKPYRLWAIILFAAFLVPQFVQAKPPPPPLVKWTPRILQQPLQAGQSILVRITAVATLDMYRAVVVPSPSIAPFVKIEPPGIRKSVKKGGKIVRNLRITIPGDFTGVNIEGLVQISAAITPSGPSRVRRGALVLSLPVQSIQIPQPLVSNLVLFSNQDDPNLLSFDLLGTGRVDLRGSKDANGIPLQVESLSVTDSAGESDQFFDSEGRVSQVVAADGSVIDFEWQPDGQVVISAVTGDGAAQANISLDPNSAPLPSMAPAAGLSQQSADPIGDQIVAALTRNRRPRPPLSVVPVPPKPAQKFTASRAEIAFPSAGPTSQIVAQVKQCSLPASGARVVAAISPNGSTVSSSQIAKETGQGTYVASIATQPSKLQDYQGYCTNALGWVRRACQADKGPSGAPGAGKFSAFMLLNGCQLLAGALVEVPLAAAAVQAACRPTFATFQASCIALNDPAGLAPGAYCAGLTKIVDSFIERGANIHVSARKLKAFVSADQTVDVVPSQINFALDLPIDKSIIESLVTSPVDPGDGQGYVATATASCLAGPQTTLEIFVSGTDGYSDTVVCPPAAPVCQIAVPGGASGIQDTIVVRTADFVQRFVSLVF